MNIAGGVGVITTITAGIVGAFLAVFITKHCAKTGELLISQWRVCIAVKCCTGRKS